MNGAEVRPTTPPPAGPLEAGKILILLDKCANRVARKGLLGPPTGATGRYANCSRRRRRPNQITGVSYELHTLADRRRDHRLDRQHGDAHGRTAGNILEYHRR